MRSQAAKFIISMFVWLYVQNAHAQYPCAFSKDSCLLPPGNSKVEVQLLEVKIKNNYDVQFMQAGSRQFLKLIVTDNLGFGKTGPLLLRSGSKQMYFKSVTLSVINKGSACFVLELYPNYLVTLSGEGLSSIEFNNTSEFTIPKSDSENIKLLAKCFYSLTARN